MVTQVSFLMNVISPSNYFKKKMSNISHSVNFYFLCVQLGKDMTIS